MNYAVIDVETTGGSPSNSKVTEIAIYKHDGNTVIDSFVTLVNPETIISEFVRNLTGISNKMVENAPKFYEIAKKIVEFTKDTVFVAHNVNFDYSTIRHEFKQLGYDFRLPHLCTVTTSRNLLPNKDSYSLGKLCKSLGIELIGRHRAGGDAKATAALLSILLEKSNNDLSSFIIQEIDTNLVHPKLDLNVVEKIPNKAGVYQLLNEHKQLLYVGYSKQIRSSIETHLKNIPETGWCGEIASTYYELSGSELIAYILAHQIIEKRQAKYNQIKTEIQTNFAFEQGKLTPKIGNDTFYLLGKGRNKSERSLIYVQHGLFRGIGFAPYHMNRLEPSGWDEFITYFELADEVLKNVMKQIKRSKSKKITI